MYKVRIRTHGRIRKIEKSCGLRVAFLMGATTYQKAQPLQSLQSVIFATFSKAQPATAQLTSLENFFCIQLKIIAEILDNRYCEIVYL